MRAARCFRSLRAMEFQSGPLRRRSAIGTAGKSLKATGVAKAELLRTQKCRSALLDGTNFTQVVMTAQLLKSLFPSKVDAVEENLVENHLLDEKRI
ncbi:hypothetical protein SAMN04488557_2234 [Hyphomicrobium facile]|uniref:Uncharacterized protein n=1 Tax=Hyphomicrobium facile TaxID=51670 RepID=A0A1I7NHK4_9HYPH|nr:hypothetical protein SAMN04488557_2234 [Hyphomicrobium facile]